MERNESEDSEQNEAEARDELRTQEKQAEDGLKTRIKKGREGREGSHKKDRRREACLSFCPKFNESAMA